MKTHDSIFTWQGFGNGFGKWDSKCRIRVYNHDGVDVVVATELHDNAGTSLTNCIENVTMMVMKKLELNHQKLVVIQHEPDFNSGLFGSKKEMGQFSSVDFQMMVKKNELDPTGKSQTAILVSPTWKPLKLHHVESIIGEKLND